MIRFLGLLWWYLLPVRRAHAVTAFSEAFPDLDPKRLQWTVGSVAWSYVELLLGRRMVIEGMEATRGGGICLAGHGGAWDLALVSGGETTPVTIFVKPPTNRFAAWVVARLRGGSDVQLLPPRGSMAAAYAALDAGRLVAFVQDQRHNNGVPSTFFGRPAQTSAAFAAMVWRRRAPVFGMWQWREPDGTHRGRMVPLVLQIPEDRDAAIAALTQASQDFYEAQIRAYPADWWWLHRRWRGGRAPGDEA